MSSTRGTHYMVPLPSETPPALEVLDPSPVDEDVPYLNSDISPSSDALSSAEKGYFPAQSSTIGLQRHRHSPSYYLRRAQRYSSYTFTVFAAFHIANTSLIPLATQSLDSSNNALLLTRPYYQSWPLAEPLIVLAPLAIHITSGVALRIYHRRTALRQAGAETHAERKTLARRTAWPSLSATGALGYALVPLVAGHAALTRALPLWVDGGSSGIGVDFVGHGVAMAPILGYAGFVALTGVAGFHMVWGWAHWLGLTPQQVHLGRAGKSVESRRKVRFWGVNGVAALVVALWAAGGLGVVASAGKVAGWVGREYDELYKQVPVLHRWT